MQEAKATVQGSIFKIGKLRKEYVDSNIQSRLNAAISAWSQDKHAFEEQETENEASENERYAAEFNANRTYMSNLINGGDDEISEAVESWISSCELPVEINVDYDWNRNDHIMYLDVVCLKLRIFPKMRWLDLQAEISKKKRKRRLL